MHKHNYRDRIQFEDVDVYGIAHHSKLINLLERARVQFFSEQGLSLTDGRFNLVVARMSIRFCSTVQMMEDVLVTSHIHRLSSMSLIWAYEIFRGETLVLQADVKLASIDLKTQKPVAIDSKIRKVLEQLVVEGKGGN